MFLLSLQEAFDYFPKVKRGKTLDAALEHYPANRDRVAYLEQDPDKAAWWWLRSPGYYPSFVSFVFTGGGLRGGNFYADGGGVSTVGGVRPAFWLNLES